MAAAVPGLTGDRRRVRLAVLGSPISHSLSPVLHMTAYAELGLTWWRYEAIECDEAGLPGFLDQCGPDWAGLSLTMPLKRTVLPLLDRTEPLVTEVGAANTVIFTAAQRQGYNTDVPGMVRAMSGWRAGKGASAIGPGTGQALIIGGGATACAALAALRDIGVWSAAVAVRDPARTVNVRAAASRLGMTITLRPFEPASAADAQLIIATAPAGATDIFAGAFAGYADPAMLVFDVVYHPWPTALALAAERAGAAVIGGFDLLLYQAAAQVELLTGRPAPVREMRRAGLAELGKRSGTVIG